MRSMTRLFALFAFSILTINSVATTAGAAQACQDIFSQPKQLDPASNFDKRNVRPIFGAKRDLSEVSQLKIMAYNMENFFLGLGRFKGMTDAEFKKATDSEKVTPARQQAIADVILENKPDFIVVEEVEGLETIQTFSDKYLGGRYEAKLIEGNDERGIQVGFLVIKDLPLDVKLETHKDMTWVDPNDNKKGPVFSRDAPALIVSRKGSTDPLFIFIGNHAKSQRDRTDDPGSHILRAAQFEAIGKIIDGYQSQYGKDVNVMVGGDFNIDVRGAPEMVPLNQRNMIDPFDAFGIKGLDRMTHTFHPRGGRSSFHQLDAILVTPSLKESLSSIVAYRYKDAAGNAKPLPQTYDERSQNPSDHFPLILTITTEKMFPEAFAPAAKAAGF